MPLTGTTNISPDIEWPRYTTRKKTTYEVILNRKTTLSWCHLVGLIRRFLYITKYRPKLWVPASCTWRGSDTSCQLSVVTPRAGKREYNVRTQGVRE